MALLNVSYAPKLSQYSASQKKTSKMVVGVLFSFKKCTILAEGLLLKSALHMILTAGDRLI